MATIAPLSISDSIFQAYVSAEMSPAVAGSDELPTLLVCWPYGRTNRYQDLLYSRAWEHGCSILGINTLEQLEAVSWPGRVVFHAHWFAPLFRGLVTEEQALAAVELAFDRIGDFRERTGARLLWTAHNLSPHNTPFARASLELRRRTFRLFDAVHLLSRDHLPLLIDAYGCAPNRFFVVPHMLYDGVYPNFIGRERARELLGISPRTYVFGAFGSIQAYKGLHTLVHAFRELVESGRSDSLLLIAGAPGSETAEQDLRALVGSDGRILLDVRRIPDDQVQIHLNSFDVMVFCYEDTLNSGVASLAATFGKKMIVPRTPAFRDLTKGGATSYSADSEADLTASMMRAYDTRDGQPGSDDPGPSPWRHGRGSRELSDRFFRSLSSIGLFDE